MSHEYANEELWPEDLLDAERARLEKALKVPHGTSRAIDLNRQLTRVLFEKEQRLLECQAFLEEINGASHE